MAKQTFTVGQILTSAQMTSLQATAMGGGAATAKTASYVLVGSDAGTTVAMNAAGATTITVNTALFAAGDTVFIQNLGAGSCTITAGTATVSTAGSLILPQYDAGILYFTSASTAIFYDYIQTGAASPLTTKGDLYTFAGSDTRLGVGANNTVLTADSAEATGLKWAAAAGGGANWTLLNSGGTALTGASTITVSGISSADKVMVLFGAASSGTASSEMSIRLNTDTGSNYHRFGQYNQPAATYTVGNYTIENGSADTRFFLAAMGNNASAQCAGYAMITGCNSSGVKVIEAVGAGSTGGGNSQIATSLGGYYNSSTVISSVSIVSSTGNFDNGTIYVYTSA